MYIKAEKPKGQTVPVTDQVPLRTISVALSCLRMLEIDPINIFILPAGRVLGGQ